MKSDRKSANARYRAKYPEKTRSYSRERRRRVKMIVLDRYGNVCCRCGFSDIRALQIDHIHNNGSSERRANGGKHFAGWNFYEYLIKSGLPEGYQTLCANCNMIKQMGENF